MFNRLSKMITVTMVWATPFITHAQSVQPFNTLTTNEATSIPAGWIQFCERHPGDCRENEGPEKVLLLSPGLYKRISTLNRNANKTIDPVSDMDHFKVADDWDYPKDGKGDCEDIALHKRKLLVKMGVPPEALALAVVDFKNNPSEKHAVLVLHTDSGDFVLDNLIADVKNWQNTSYNFKKIQSPLNPNVWLEVTPVQSSRQELYNLIEENAAR